MCIIRLWAILGGLALWCGLATATYAGTYTYSGYGFSGENVHITDTLLGVENEYGGAGLITLDGATPIAAYCVDIADWLLGSGTYTTGVNPASDRNLMGLSSFTGHSKVADIAALIAHGTNPAAVQIAIWETEYGSAVSITPDNPGLMAVANTYLAELGSTWTAPYGLVVLELVPIPGEVNQTLVYRGNVAEPGSMALLGMAIAGLGYAQRRCRARGG